MGSASTGLNEAGGKGKAGIVANYVSQTRTNYFKVKDPEAFKAWCKTWITDMDVVPGSGEDGELYTILIPGSPPDARRDDPETEWFEADFIEELAEHLEEEWVAVIMQIGHEKQRYVGGYAVAINSRGDHQTVNLDDIYVTAKELGEHITRAEY